MGVGPPPMAQSWRDEMDAPEEIRRAMPRGYDVIGSVAIIRIDPELAEWAHAAGEALLEGVPNAKTAAIDWGVEGQVRARNLEVVAGEPSLVTEQKENGCRLLVDVETCYYSPRLAGERARVADQVDADERVLDMYCGVGPYAVLIARQQGARVLGLEINPRAAELARENASRNKVPELVDIVQADAPRLTRAMPPVFDRVIMNLPHTAVDHLEDALPACKPGAILHVGAMLAKDDADEEAAEIVEGLELALEELVKIRDYNPAVGHYSLELRMPETRTA